MARAVTVIAEAAAVTATADRAVKAAVDVDRATTVVRVRTVALEAKDAVTVVPAASAKPAKAAVTKVRLRNSLPLS